MNAFRNSLLRTLGFAFLCIGSGSASALGTSGASSSIVFPLASNTTSFETEVFVTNRHYAAMTIDVLYYEAQKLDSPGLKACTPISLAASETKSFKLATQCPALNDGVSHFGLLVLRDGSTEKIKSFYAYSRVQHVTTRQGFSVEGFPEHVFSGSPAIVAGLKRSEPGTFNYGQFRYQANCFVGSLGDPVNYRITLVNAAGAQIAGSSLIEGSLAPYQLIRYLDVFKAAGLPDANAFENVRANFEARASGQLTDDPALIGYCTQQENQGLDADFRIAKSVDALNNTQRKLRCRGTTTDYATIVPPDPDDCAKLSTSPVNMFAIPDANTMHQWSMFVHHPSSLKCTIVGPNIEKLEMRLLPPSGLPIGVGGNDAREFYFDYPNLTNRNSAREAAYGDGTQAFWTLEVSKSEGIAQTYPIPYGLRCYSGSGIHMNGGPTEIAGDTF